MTHPNEDGWKTHLKVHIEYLLKLTKDGTLKASGPLVGKSTRNGFLILKTADLQEVEQIVAKDPFSTEGLIDELTITEWDPVFGLFASEASGQVPPDLQALLGDDVPGRN